MKPVTMYVMVAFHLALILCAFTLPGLFATGEEPIVAGAMEVLTTMGFLGMAGLVALLMMVIVIRQREDLSRPALVAGVAPAIISVLAIIGLAMMIQVKKANEEARRKAAVEESAIAEPGEPSGT